MDANHQSQHGKNTPERSEEHHPITIKVTPGSTPDLASTPASQSETDLLEKEVVTTLKTVYHQIDQQFNSLYEQNELNEARVEILKVLATHHPHGCTQVELAQSLEQSEANISAMVTRMRRDGWIYRLRSQVDRRKSNLLLTTKSLEKLANLDSAVSQLYRQLFQSLSQEETLQLSRDLTKLHLGLTQPGTSQPSQPFTAPAPGTKHPAAYLQSAENTNEQRPVA